MAEELKKYQKLLDYSKDPDLAYFDGLNEMNENLETVNETFKGLDLSNLETLKGDKGDKGDQGEQGPMGPQGIQGIQGIQGLQGRDGLNGLNGLDGIDGQDGKDGKDGEKGEKGDKPKHEWNGTSLRFENPDGSWGQFINLQGPQGNSYAMFGGGGGTSLSIRSAGTLISGAAQTINFTGSGVTVTKVGETITVDITGGGGGISGPVSSTDNAVVRWDGTAGDTVQDSILTIGDSGMMTWTAAGEAITAGSYQVGRDADGTNQIHFNVPTGAGWEWSINDSAMLTLTSSDLRVLMSSPQISAGTSSAGLVIRGNRVAGSTAGDVNVNSQVARTAGFLLNVQNNSTNVAQFAFHGGLTITQAVVNAGTPNLLVLTGAAHTASVASTELIDVNVNLARTVQFATGAVATQRAVLFQAPTYSFVAASTITDTATVAISGPPVAGTNATLTNTDALWLQAGALRMENYIKFNSGVALTSTQYLIGKTASTTLQINVPAGSNIILSFGGAADYTFDSGGVDLSNNGLRWTSNGSVTATAVQIIRISGSLVLNEPTGGIISIRTNNVEYFAVTDNLVTVVASRFREVQGADVASAGDLTLGNGNTFEVTGTTTINAITTANWNTGNKVTLIFAGSLTVSHNTAGGGGTAVILLAGAANFSATAGDTLTLVYSEQGGTNAWRELSRTVI